MVVLEMEIKYEGYIKREQDTIEYRIKNMQIPIPENFNYDMVSGIKKEAIQKLTKHKPPTLEKALQISGVDPSDIDILLIHIVDKKKSLQAK